MRSVYEPNWIYGKHTEKRWADWKLAHPKWEIKLEEMGLTEIDLKVWVTGATSFVPGVGSFADYDTGPLAREIKKFWDSEFDSMPFGSGMLIKVIGVPSTTGAPSVPSTLKLYDGDALVLAMVPVFIGEALLGYLAADLLKEAWYFGALEVLDSCLKINVPLEVLYEPSIVELQQRVSSAVTAHMTRCGLLTVSIEVVPNMVEVNGVLAYTTCSVRVEVAQEQTPVARSSGMGAMAIVNTWGK